MSLKLAIIGCGAATRKYYLPILRAYAKVSLDIVCVDSNINRAKSAAEELGSGKFAASYETVIDSVDAVIIALPHALHYRVALDCIRKGCHVLCEKPLAESSTQAAEMITEANKFAVRLIVNNTRRLFPSFMKIHKLLMSGEIGSLISVRYLEANKFGWEGSTGFYVDHRISRKGVLLDLGAHVLDLVCWWLNEKPVLLTYKDDSYGGPESLCHFDGVAGDCRVEIILNRHITFDSHFEILGTGGIITGEPYNWSMFSLGRTRQTFRKIHVESSINAYRDLVASLIMNFLDVVVKGGPSLISACELLPSIELIEECYNSRDSLNMPWNNEIARILC